MPLLLAQDLWEPSRLLLADHIPPAWSVDVSAVFPPLVQGPDEVARWFKMGDWDLELQVLAGPAPCMREGSMREEGQDKGLVQHNFILLRNSCGAGDSLLPRIEDLPGQPYPVAKFPYQGSIMMNETPQVLVRRVGTSHTDA